MAVKSFNSCIALCNFIITICTSNTSILTTQVPLKSGGTEINSGPKKKYVITFCHLNLNRLTGHSRLFKGTFNPLQPGIAFQHQALMGSLRLSLLHTILTFLLCLSETFLYSTILQNDETININGYSLLGVNHPNKIK